MRLNFVIAMLGTALACTGARAETLNLLTWEKYLSPRVIEAWTRETGVEIDQIYYDNADDRDRIIAEGNSQVDLAVIGENTTRAFKDRNLLTKIQARDVPTIVNASTRWRDRCSDYGLPYMWGTLGIIYRADKLAVAPRSWADLLRPAPEVAGHIAMLKGLEDILTPPLILAGKSVNSQDEEDLKTAFQELKKQAPSVLTYDYVVTSIQDPKVGPDIFMALAFSGDQFILRTQTGSDWHYVVPNEGSVLWVDCMSVLAASKKHSLSFRFLDFINRPEISAMNAADLSMPTANGAALPKLPAEMRDDPQIFPPQSVIDASSFYEEYGADIAQVRKRIVNSLLKFHDAH